MDGMGFYQCLNLILRDYLILFDEEKEGELWIKLK
jgi:hypothetical protein